MRSTISQKAGRKALVWIFAATMLVLLAGLAFLSFRPRRNSSTTNDSRFANDPRFVLTRLSERRIFVTESLKQNPGPAFPPSAVRRYSIYGLLDQCTKFTGVRYVMLKDVAAGTVEFGHTNPLTSAQWVQAFTAALEHAQPEWRDSKTRTLKKENLIVLTNDSKTVLVLPQAMASEFQNRGAD